MLVEPSPSCGNSHREIKSSRLQAHPCISTQTQARSPGQSHSIPSIAQPLQQELHRYSSAAGSVRSMSFTSPSATGVCMCAASGIAHHHNQTHKQHKHQQRLRIIARRNRYKANVKRTSPSETEDTPLLKPATSTGVARSLVEPSPSCGNSHREVKSSRLQAHPCISKTNPSSIT